MVAESVYTWNFVLTGQHRSGVRAVLSGINTRAEAVCHRDLFHKDPDVRQLTHEKYFGKQKQQTRIPEWYMPELTSPLQYLTRNVFDNPRRSELAIGCHLSYDDIRSMELYDLLALKAREGNFSVIQVTRSPLACLISLKQAVHSNIWEDRTASKERNRIPQPVRLEVEEVTQWWNDHHALEAKISAACDDRLVVPYRRLVLDYQVIMAEVFDFIELPAEPKMVQPTCRRLRNRSLVERVSNWAEVKALVTSEIRCHIDSDDFF